MQGGEAGVSHSMMREGSDRKVNWGLKAEWRKRGMLAGVSRKVLPGRRAESWLSTFLAIRGTSKRPLSLLFFFFF